MKENNRIYEFVALASVKLAAIELGLGGLLHSFHVPLSGHFLSLNQIFLLSRANRQLKNSQKTIPCQVSFITSCLKSLSPAGKKLGPMLAIMAQGILFNLGSLFLGINLLGHMVGAILSSLWAFIQPVALYFLVYQKDLKDIYQYYLKLVAGFIDLSTQGLQEKLIYILITMVLVKIILAIIVTFLSFYLPESKIESYENKMLKNSTLAYSNKKGQDKAAWKGALKDLCNPLFMVSIIFTLVFFIFAEHDYSKTIWVVLRPVILAYIIFLLLRITPVEKWAQKIVSGETQSNLQKSLALVLIKIRNLN